MINRDPANSHPITDFANSHSVNDTGFTHGLTPVRIDVRIPGKYYDVMSEDGSFSVHMFNSGKGWELISAHGDAYRVARDILSQIPLKDRPPEVTKASRLTIWARRLRAKMVF